MLDITRGCGRGRARRPREGSIREEGSERGYELHLIESAEDTRLSGNEYHKHCYRRMLRLEAFQSTFPQYDVYGVVRLSSRLAAEDLITLDGIPRFVSEPAAADGAVYHQRIEGVMGAFLPFARCARYRLRQR